MNGPVAEKHIGVARAKRRRLSRLELRAAHTRARAVLARAGWAAGTVRLTPLAVSDLTQTYRIRAAGASAILKMLPSAMAASTLQAQALLSARGIALPAVRWSDADRGAILYEDLGSAGLATAPDPAALERAVTYLARLHAAGVVEPAAAAEIVPAIAAHGWPTPAELAGRLLTQVRAETPAARRSLLDLVSTLAAWIGTRPRIVVGDIKREHFRFSRGDARAHRSRAGLGVGCHPVQSRDLARVSRSVSTAHRRAAPAPAPRALRGRARPPGAHDDRRGKPRSCGAVRRNAHRHKPRHRGRVGSLCLAQRRAAASR